jgi:sulfur-oxidizing protein SoxX
MGAELNIHRWMREVCLARRGLIPPQKGSIHMKTDIMRLFALVALGLMAGCDAGLKSGRGFVFPEGDVVRGQQAFIELKCYACHRVDGVVSLPAPMASPEKVVILGGKVARLRTYGDLVTSVIHPTYELSEKLLNRASYEEGKESPMRSFNDTMTVTQMLDIVTFLHPRYQKLEPLYNDFHGR